MDNKGQPPPYSSAGHPPPPGFTTSYPPPPPQGPGVTIVTQQPVVITSLGPESQIVTCPHCHHQISTRVESEASTKTHLIALLLCLFVCWPCVCLPYCMDSCQNRNHSCPNCGAFLGTYSN